MLYMLIEHFRDGDPVPVYRRFREQGRMAPDGLRYVGSWITQDLGRCYQVMECDDPALLHRWMERWADLCEFEVIAVVTSVEAQAAVAPRLDRSPAPASGRRRGTPAGHGRRRPPARPASSASRRAR